MSGASGDIAARLTQAVSARLRPVAGNIAILMTIALLGITTWVAVIVVLVALLAPLWGMAVAVSCVALFCTLATLVLLAVLRRRANLHRREAEILRSQSRRNVQAAVLAAVPGALRTRPGVLLVGSGFLLGAMIVALLHTPDDR